MRLLLPTALLISSAAIASACNPGPKTTGDSGNSSNNSTDTPLTTDVSTTSTSTTRDTGDTSPTTAPPTTTTTESTPSSEDSSIFPRYDAPPGACSLAAQDCADGWKCNPANFNNDQNVLAGQPICVPVVPGAVPPGAPCSVLGDPLDGTDDCQLGSACLFPDDNGDGKCLTFCALEGLTCAADQHCFGQSCQVCLFGYCADPCDPRQLDACNPQEVCVSSDAFWTCLLDASGAAGQAGAPCEFLNACDPGLTCINADQIPGCNNAGGCCSPMCSTDAPNTCPNAAQGETCVPWYADDDAPPQLATLGVCSVPL